MAMHRVSRFVTDTKKWRKIQDDCNARSPSLLDRIIERLRRSYHRLDLGGLHGVSCFPEEDPVERMLRTEYHLMWKSLYERRRDPADFARR